MAVAGQKFSTLMGCSGELGVIQVGPCRTEQESQIRSREKIRSEHRPFPFKPATYKVVVWGEAVGNSSHPRASRGYPDDPARAGPSGEGA